MKSLCQVMKWLLLIALRMLLLPRFSVTTHWKQLFFFNSKMMYWYGRIRSIPVRIHNRTLVKQIVIWSSCHLFQLIYLVHESIISVFLKLSAMKSVSVDIWFLKVSFRISQFWFNEIWPKVIVWNPCVSFLCYVYFELQLPHIEWLFD